MRFAHHVAIDSSVNKAINLPQVDSLSGGMKSNTFEARSLRILCSSSSISAVAPSRSHNFRSAISIDVSHDYRLCWVRSSIIMLVCI